MLVEVIYMIGMAGVIACNGLILIAQYQLRRSSKTTINVYVASLSVSAIIFACIFAPTVFAAHFQMLAPFTMQTLEPPFQALETPFQMF